jgi:hypothetical protein
VINYLVIMWWNIGEWRYSSTIVDLGRRCRGVVSFTLRPLTPGTHLKGGWVSLRTTPDDVERSILALQEIEPRPPTHSYTDWAIPDLGTITWILFLERMWKEATVVLSRDWQTSTEEIQRQRYLKQSVSLMWFEPGTPKIQVRRVITSPVLFCDHYSNICGSR